jgi:methyltransferase (TIGR00027 family)
MSSPELSRRHFLRATALAAGIGASPFHRALALEGGQPSRTASGAARHRAAHQLLENPKVLDDPFALPILGERDAAWLRANLGRQQTASARTMRAFIVMRSRYAEDCLAQAAARGVRQYVVLGAGLDTFACRNPHPSLQVFEVDYPPTQAWKRARLEQIGVGLPGSLVFAPVDFERQTLAEGLEAAGFRASEPAFFSLLGVVVYLSKPAVAETLRYIAARPAGSGVVFDFAPPAESISETEQASRDRSSARVARAGEPWINYYRPGALADELRTTGFAQTRILDTAEGNEQYFKGRADGFRLHGSGRMMAASV